MTARLALVRGRVLPNGWVDLLRQCSLFGGAYLLYRLVEGIVGGNSSVAFAHARELISLERGMHIFVEPTVQGWATSSHLLVVIATYVYLNAQTTILIALLLYLYIAHNRSYYFVRNMLFVGMAIGLIGYGLFPTAPPRFLPEWGFIDTIQQITGVSGNSTIANVFFNQYAAVPSMHVACAVMLGWTLVPPRPPPRRQGLLGDVAAVHHVHDGDHRQSLPDRRRARPVRRRHLVRRRPAPGGAAAARLDLRLVRHAPSPQPSAVPAT